MARTRTGTGTIAVWSRARRGQQAGAVVARRRRRTIRPGGVARRRLLLVVVLVGVPLRLWLGRATIRSRVPMSMYIGWRLLLLMYMAWRRPVARRRRAISAIRRWLLHVWVRCWSTGITSRW